MSAAIREVPFVPGKHCNRCGNTRREAAGNRCIEGYYGFRGYDQHDWRLPPEEVADD